MFSCKTDNGEGMNRLRGAERVASNRPTSIGC